jgi:hypothetical protein
MSWPGAFYSRPAVPRIMGIRLWAKGAGTWLCLGIARRDRRPDVRRAGMPPEPVV